MGHLIMKFVDCNYIPYTPTRFLSFDDVTILPTYSTIPSRKDPRISTECNLTPGYKMRIPIVSAPMESVTEGDMAIAMARAGGVGIIHRYYKDKETWLNDIVRIHKEVGTVALSIGASKEDAEQLKEVIEKVGPIAVAIDVAHQHLKIALDQIKRLRDLYKEKVTIISGSICTVGAAADAISAGANALRVGIGNGHVCSTRVVTGCGMPQLSAIMGIRRALYGMKSNATLIADGGIRNSGDIVKAIAAGADCVMVGKLLAGADESSAILTTEYGLNLVPDEVIEGVHYYTPECSTKIYRGQASEDFMKVHKKAASPEGVTIQVNKTGSVKQTLDNLVGGLRSAMTYTNCLTLDDLYNTTNFIEISHNAYIEGTPHGLNS